MARPHYLHHTAVAVVQGTLGGRPVAQVVARPDRVDDVSGGREGGREEWDDIHPHIHIHVYNTSSYT